LHPQEKRIFRRKYSKPEQWFWGCSALFNLQLVLLNSSSRAWAHLKEILNTATSDGKGGISPLQESIWSTVQYLSTGGLPFPAVLILTVLQQYTIFTLAQRKSSVVCGEEWILWDTLFQALL